MALALSQNPQIAAARALETQAAAHGEQAAAAGLPAVNLVAAIGPSLTAKLVPGTAVESTRSSTNLRWSDVSVAVGGELQIIQPLYTFGKISERKRAAGLEQKAREAQTDMTRADVAFEVAGFYEAYLLARDALRFFEEMERWLTRTIEDTEAEVAAGGAVTEQDLLRLGTAMSVVRMGMNQVTAVMHQTAGGLEAYLVLPKGSTAEPTEDTLELLPTVSLDKQALSVLALRERPEVRGLAAGSGAYLALADAEEAGNLPDFFAMAALSAAHTPGRDWLQTRFVVDPLNHFVPTVLVGARWQWNGGMANARGAENRALAADLQHKAVWAEGAIPAEVNRAHQRVIRAFQDSAEADKAVTLAKKWLVSASADYSVGMGDSRNVAEAAQSYVQLRLAGFDARFRHNVALAELAKVTGTLTAANSPFYPTRAEGAERPIPSPVIGTGTAHHSTAAAPSTSVQSTSTQKPAAPATAPAAAAATPALEK